MPVLRAYMAASQGTLPGRGPLKGDPFFGALAGLVAKPLARLGGKAIRKMAQQVKQRRGGSAAITRAAKGAGGFGVSVGAGVIGTKIAGRFGGAGGVRRYKRMNAGNAKALRRAFRRIDSFTKLAAKCGYVRRKPFGARKSKGKIC